MEKILEKIDSYDILNNLLPCREYGITGKRN